MIKTQPSWRAAPLEWGHGAKAFEVFLEPTCPFSAIAFGKLEPFLELVRKDQVTVKIRLLSQPWHMFSGIVTRAILAASTTPKGREAAQNVMAAVFNEPDAFEFEKHCTGPNLYRTPNDIIVQIEKSSGMAIQEAFAIPDLDQLVKWHTRYARQNGIHISPTFMVNGLIQPDLGSRDSIEIWAQNLAS
jgi:hypothetical protein